MKIHDFPYNYEAERKRIAQKPIHEELAYSEERQSSIRNGIIDYDLRDGAGATLIGFVSVGFIIGFFKCLCAETFRGGFATWLVLTLLSSSVGIVVILAWKALYNKTKHKAEIASSNERKRRDAAIRKIHEQAERDIAAYAAEFEAEAQRMSVNYAESTLATEVIEWMTAGFSATITAADRSEHIEKIVVPFSFKVFDNKICCDRGTYDFKVKRCANLTSPLQQAALARAIASAIHLNIIMEYPSDTSGTEHMITTNYEYTSCSVEVTITYTAPNGHYRAVQNW